MYMANTLVSVHFLRCPSFHCNLTVYICSVGCLESIIADYRFWTLKCEMVLWLIWGLSSMQFAVHVWNRKRIINQSFKIICCIWCLKQIQLQWGFVWSKISNIGNMASYRVSYVDLPSTCGSTRYHFKFESQFPHSNLCKALAPDQKWSLICY